jgi:Ca2+-binding RTX toxin-like protein
MTVTMSASGDVAEFAVGNSGQISVRDASAASVVCASDPLPVNPTVENTSRIRVFATVFGAQTAVINDPGAFVDPTGGDEGLGVDEIEFNPIDLGDSNTDTLRLQGGGAADRFVYGPGGINPNAGEGAAIVDADIFHSGVDGEFGGHVAEGGSGSDVITAAGGAGTGTTPFAARVRMGGGNDADALTGGAAADRLDGANGTDTLDGGFGGDTLMGGDDFDTLTYGNRNESVEVTISDPGSISFVSGSANDDTGGLRDGVAEDVEALRGGGGDDRLTGDGDPNSLAGGAGIDNLRGLAGGDTFFGELGNDTVAGGGGSDSASGGPGGDNLAGGEGADDLFGETGNDRLDGNRGSDLCSGGAGNADTARNCEATTGVP